MLYLFWSSIKIKNNHIICDIDSDRFLLVGIKDKYSIYMVLINPLILILDSTNNVSVQLLGGRVTHRFTKPIKNLMLCQQTTYIVQVCLYAWKKLLQKLLRVLGVLVTVQNACKPGCP